MRTAAGSQQAGNWWRRAHVRAGGDQLAVSGDGDTPVGRILWESGVAGNQSIGHQTEQQAALAPQQPVFGGILAGHPKSGCARQVIFFETQGLAVAVAAFGLAELVHQAGPVPLAIDREQHGQAQAERIEGWRAKMTFQAHTEVGPPGGEVEQAQTQVEGVHPRQVGAGMDLIGRQPVVAGATGAALPGRGRPGLGNWNGSMGRMASQRKNSTKLGMSKRRSAAGMERVSASSEREGLCNWWNGLSGIAMAGTRGAQGMRSLFIGAASDCAARCDLG